MTAEFLKTAEIQRKPPLTINGKPPKEIPLTSLHPALPDSKIGNGLEEDRGKKYTTSILVVLGKEKKEVSITGNFMQIQIINLLIAAKEEDGFISGKDLLTLYRNDLPHVKRRRRLHMDISTLRKKLENHGLKIINTGWSKKRGATTAYGLAVEHESNSTTNSPSVLTILSTGEAEKVNGSQPTISPSPAVQNLNRENGNRSRKSPSNSTDIFRRITPRDIAGEDFRKTIILANERNQKIEEIEIDLTRTAVSLLTAKDILQKADRSPTELLLQVIPEEANPESLLGIAETDLKEYLIKCIAKTISRIWDIKNVTILSEKERQIWHNLALLSQQGYNKKNIEQVIRVLFSIPAPAPAQAQANKLIQINIKLFLYYNP